MQKLIVLCDRTWFESEKHTQSNIFRLAKLIGIDMTQQTLTRTEPILYHDDRRCIRACYFPGSGLDETFLKYLFRDVTVDAIHNDCIEVYKYIVDHYTPGTEIWMFGLSCGAYTVRCVAGMINNCGILRQTIDTGPIDLDWCRRVYGIYRSRRHDDHPKDPSILSFKSQFSYNEPMPVKFMGLLDTVGNLGVPTFDEDNRLTLSEYYRRTLGEYSRRIFGEYNRRTLGEDNGPTLNTFLGLPEFYDRKVSSVVEKVYHALSIHDRLRCFEPCHALRAARHKDNTALQIHERWFPGCHYDIGGQQFRFLCKAAHWIKNLVGPVPVSLSRVIEPNRVLADVVLRWMLESIRNEDSQGTVIQEINVEIKKLIAEMRSATTDTGSGDIYDDIFSFGRAGNTHFFMPVLGKIFWPARTVADTISEWFDWRRSIDIISKTLGEARERRIPDFNEEAMGYNVEVMHYKTPEVELGNKSIEELGRMESIVTRRYPSQTYENFIANWENFEAVDATIPKSYIVVLRKGHTAERFGNKFESIRRHLGEDPNQSKITEMYVSIPAFHAILSPDMYVEIASTHEVAYIQRAQFFKMSVPSPWGLSRISKRDQHLYLSPYQCPGNEGENVVVYVMDSGVDIRNPEFENRATCPPLANFAAGCHPVTDEHGHGTHVAAIIGGIRYGVAKKATIISVKVFDGITQINGSESESGILAGIDWVIKNIGHQKAKVGFVVNMSFSGPHSLYMNDLVELLFKKNVPVIVAAGNDPNRNTVNASPSGAPGAYTVAAMGQNNNPYDSNSWGRRVNIFAPGVNITSAWIGGLDMTLDGTSAAAAHVTGVAALYLSDNRYLTAQDLYDSLTNNATKGVIQGDLGGSPNLVAFNRAHSHTRLLFHNWFQSLLKL